MSKSEESTESTLKLTMESSIFPIEEDSVDLRLILFKICTME